MMLSTPPLRSPGHSPAGVPKSVQDLEYQWRSNSSLYRRFDRRNTTTTGDDYTDTFAYDVLERVTAQTTSVGACRTLSFAYSSWGNLTSKTSSIGGDLNVTADTYVTTGKPHRLTSVTLAGVANTLAYDGNGNITTYNAASGNDTFLSYDGQNQVTRITVGVSAGTTTPTARDEFSVGSHQSPAPRAELRPKTHTGRGRGIDLLNRLFSRHDSKPSQHGAGT